MATANTMEMDDDPVVQEVDVYLAKALAESLFMVQYPVRPGNKTYERASHHAARVKPVQQRFELEIGLNTESPNYSQSKGEQIAINVDSNPQNKGPYYHSNVMDKQVLTSIPSGLKTRRYCVGYFKDSELHLTPIKGIVQMRPSFEYLDKADGKPEKEVIEDEDEQPKAVTVKFARTETEEAKARRMASYSYVSKKREEEAWIAVEHHVADDPVTEAMRSQLIAHSSRDTTELQMPSQSYLDKLIPEVEEEDNKKPPMPNNVLSLAELKSMPLNDQVKALLINAKVLRFTQLMSLLAKGTDGTTALRGVQQAAVLVQGCWVVKSEVLYPKDTFSAHSNIPAEMLCRGRDYLLWRFTQNRCVVRKDIASVIRLPAEDVKAILEQMAVLQVNKGWEFVLNYDNEFVHRHPEVVQRQQMLWEAKFQQLTKTLRLGKADIERKAKTDEQLMNSPERTRRRRTSSASGRARTKSGGERSMSDSDGEAPVRSRRVSGQGRARKASGFSSGSDQEKSRSRSNSVRELKELKEKDAQNVSANILQNPTNQMAAPQGNGSRPQNEQSDSQNSKITTQIAGQNSTEMKPEPMEVCANGTDSNVAQTAQASLDDYVRDKMLVRRVMSIKDLRTHLEMKLVEWQAGHVLATGVTDKMFELSLKNTGCVPIPETEEPLYIYLKIGDQFDTLRQAIFGLMKGIKCIRIAAVRKVLEESSLEFTDVDIRKVLKEYCVTKGGVYHIKGTLVPNS